MQPTQQVLWSFLNLHIQNPTLTFLNMGANRAGK